ncbi:mitochondrial_RNA_binding_protein_-_putative [Leishmania major strain Friedlin]|nr:mitochondrial_RNA_binding_protein_-_putative [Leishmania major strain Friedlin]
MRTQRLCSQLATALHSSFVRGSAAAAAAAVCTVLRHASAEAVLAQEEHANALYDDSKDVSPAADQEHAQDAGDEEPHRASLVSQLLPYVYGPRGVADDAHLSLPIDHVALRRMKKIMNVKSKHDVTKALYNVHLLETPEDCIHYVNLTASYIRQQARMEEQAQSPSLATRQRAAYVQRQLRGVRLSGLEKSTLLRKACTLVEERRVPLVVASRLLRFRWPGDLATVACGVRQPYVMDLIRSWATEALQQNELEPRDARALLSNCAFALKSAVRRRTKGGAAEPLSDISSFIGALAMKASQDANSPAKAEGLIGLMWSVHLTGCPAPASFWDTMVQRVVSMNEALEGEFASSADAAASENGTPTSAHALSTSPASSPSTKAPRAGHFFSTLSTRQLYRFLMVLKLAKWDGNPTVLHRLADQTLRNVAFELEAANFDRHVSGDSEGERAVAAAAKPSIKPFAVVNAAEVHLGMVQQKPVRLPKSVVAGRIRQVADLHPDEFLELLHLAGDLGVPFSVSATRMVDELLIPLVPHLNAKQLIVLLQVVRHTRSQSSTLMQVVMDRLVERGAAGAYALPLAKATVKTAAKAPAVFQSLRMDDFVELFTTTCEAQHTLVRAAEVAAMGDILYALSRRYEETSLQGQRIREVVNLLCAQADRLVQLQVASSSIADRLLECTVLLRMRANKMQYPAVQELLASRAVAVDQEERCRQARQERALKYVETLAAGAAEGAISSPCRESLKWEGLSEGDLPQVAKAALSVYGEFVYIFERMVTVKAVLTAKDFELFAFNIKKAGLYSILQGAQLFQQGHFEADVPYTTPASQAAAQGLSRTMPAWMDKTVTNAVLAKLSNSRISSSDTGDDFLKVLGHVHCDAAKVDAVIEMMARSPLRRLQRQRPVWLYIAELARRFGSEETKEAMSAYLKKALY